MDELNIGKKCSLDSCGKLDFLPFKCDKCKKYYCLEHAKYDAHMCQNKDNNNKPKKKSKIITYKCSKKNCNKKTKVPIKCFKCNLNYCLEHRYADTHNCGK